MVALQIPLTFASEHVLWFVHKGRDGKTELLNILSVLDYEFNIAENAIVDFVEVRKEVKECHRAVPNQDQIEYLVEEIYVAQKYYKGFQACIYRNIILCPTLISKLCGE